MIQSNINLSPAFCRRNPASVPQYQIDLGDGVWGEVENSFIALSGKGDHSRLMPSKLCVPDLEGVVRSVIVMVQRGYGQLGDILLIGWG